MKNASTSVPTFALTEKPNKPANNILISYSNLKSNIIVICTQIEESLSNIFKYVPSESNKISYDQEEEEFKKKEEQIAKMSNQIKSYKKKTKNIQNQINMIYSLNRINEIETELKEKKLRLQIAKSENKTLSSIHENQVKGLKEYESKLLKRNELVSVSERLKNFKEEYKIKKGFLKKISSQIKGQMNKMDVIEKKCKNIKDNIEYKKHQQNQQINSEREEEINNEWKKLKSEAKFHEENFKLAEKEFRGLVEEQREKIEKLRDEIKILTIKLDEIDQDMRIQELKEKEEKRKKELMKQQKRMLEQSSRARLNFVHKSNSGANVNMFNQKKEEKKARNSRQPFEIEKVLNEKVSHSSNDFLIKDPTLIQIEELRNDLVSLINQNNKIDFTKFDNPRYENEFNNQEINEEVLDENEGDNYPIQENQVVNEINNLEFNNQYL